MLLLLYFLTLLGLFHFRRKASPGLLIILLYILSLACGMLIGYDYEVDTFPKVMNLSFLAVTLTILFLPWNKFSYSVTIAEPNPKRLKTLTLALLSINGLAFVLFSIVIYHAFATVTDYSAFKNLGASEGFTRQLPINHSLFLIALYLHPTSYFLIPLHFHYLSRRKYLFSMLSLLFSLNIILNGLTVFSRSGFLVYFILYGMYLPFYYGKLSNKAKHWIKVVAVTIVCLTTFVFYLITVNRFTNTLFYKNAAYTQTYITNPVLFSIFDYFSQWYKNSNEVMSLYSFETLKGELSFPLLLMIADRLHLIDYAPGVIEERLYALWGPYFDKFNGLTVNLLFDFGYVGTLVFVSCYWLVMRKLMPRRGVLPFNQLLILGVLFVLPAMGIFNSEMKTVFYNLLIVFSLLVYLYMMVVANSRLIGRKTPATTN